MLPGECIQSGASQYCCGEKLEIVVQHSGGGYYIGTVCPHCGPYSRESGYYSSFEAAEKALKDNTYTR